MSNLSSKIIDFQENIERGNVQVINFRPYYESARNSDLTAFELLKTKLEKILSDRIAGGKGAKLIVFADAACCLTENKEFDKSRMLENWWQETHNEWTRKDQKITVVCPHPSRVLVNENLNVKVNISEAHDVTIDLDSYMLENSPLYEAKNGRSIQVLIGV
jgi:hypothetical protein